MASGKWRSSLTKSVSAAFNSVDALRYVGVKMSRAEPEAVVEQQMALVRRISRLALTIADKRARNLFEHDTCYPLRFALALTDELTDDEDARLRAVNSFRDDFQLLLSLESKANYSDDVNHMLGEIPWLAEAANRVTMMLYDRPPSRTLVDDDAQSLVNDMFDHQGDTKINEDSNNMSPRPNDKTYD